MSPGLIEAGECNTEVPIFMGANQEEGIFVLGSNNQPLVSFLK